MTTQEQIAALRKQGNGRILIRECTMCGYELAYIWRGEELFYDTGCPCTGMRGGLEPRQIKDLEDFLNMNPGWAEKRLAHG